MEAASSSPPPAPSPLPSSPIIANAAMVVARSAVEVGRQRVEDMGALMASASRQLEEASVGDEKLSSSSPGLNETQLLVVFLLSQLCRNHDPTPRLFVLNCLRFYDLGILPNVNFLVELGMIPRIPKPLSSTSVPFRANAGGMPESPSTNQLLALADSTSAAPEKEHIRRLIEHIERESLEFNDYDPMQISMSRYQRDFVEVEKLGRGGFGAVFRVRHALDGVDYAIKKINFTHRGFSAPKQKKVMREVRILARLQHENVCRYFTSWLEPTWQDSKVMGDAIMGGGSNDRTAKANDRGLSMWNGTPSSSSPITELLLSRSRSPPSDAPLGDATLSEVTPPPPIIMNLEKDVEALRF